MLTPVRHYRRYAECHPLTHTEAGQALLKSVADASRGTDAQADQRTTLPLKRRKLPACKGWRKAEPDQLSAPRGRAEGSSHQASLGDCYAPGAQWWRAQRSPVWKLSCPTAASSLLTLVSADRTASSGANSKRPGVSAGSRLTTDQISLTAWTGGQDSTAALLLPARHGTKWGHRSLRWQHSTMGLE